MWYLYKITHHNPRLSWKGKQTNMQLLQSITKKATKKILENYFISHICSEIFQNLELFSLFSLRNICMVKSPILSRFWWIWQTWQFWKYLSYCKKRKMKNWKNIRNWDGVERVFNSIDAFYDMFWGFWSTNLHCSLWSVEYAQRSGG